MTTECDRLDHGRALIGPLECKTVIGPFTENFVLTDAVLALNTYPEGLLNSHSGATVWNPIPVGVLPSPGGGWIVSRKLLTCKIDYRGHQIHLESGIVCPAQSSLSVCISFSTAASSPWVFATLSGYYCETAPRIAKLAELDPFRSWSFDLGEVGPVTEIDPLDPTMSQRDAGEGSPAGFERVLIGTDREASEPDELVIRGSEGEMLLRKGDTATFRVSGGTWTWSCGKRKRSGRGPKGTNLVVVRRSTNGHSIQWIYYHETPHEAPKRRRKRS